MHAISWPTRRLLMAEVPNEDGGGGGRDGSSPGGETPTTLASALDAVRHGYEPYADFPSAFVAEELKLLIRRHGPKFPAGEVLTDRDWKAHAGCGGGGPGERPLEIQVDYDVADFLRGMADCNGIDLDRYANHLLEGAVLAEGGVGAMLLNKSQTIGGIDVDAGTRVDASQYVGTPGNRTFFKRHVRVKIGRKTVEADVDLADLTKPEDIRQDRQGLLQRARTALAGLKLVVHPMAAQEDEAGGGMLRIACERGDEATFKVAKKRLRQAGLVAYPVKERPSVLHVRA